MFRLARTTQHEGPFEHAGRSVTLTAETWAFSVRTPWFGFGAGYRRPRFVQSGGITTLTWPIVDYLMVARIGALLAVTAATIWRRLR